MMVSKCFVIGSCVSRDMFNSKFVSEYKDSFELQVMQFQMSMLSILEPPISYPGALWDSSKMTIGADVKIMDRFFRHRKVPLPRKIFKTRISA